jgi:hypothetical protein
MRSNATTSPTHRVRLQRRRYGAGPLLLILFALSGCTTQTPALTASLPASLVLPTADCAPLPSGPNVLDCGEAVTAAAAVLSAAVPVSRVRFRYGDYCGQPDGCPASRFDRGFVVFTELTPVRGQTVDYYIVVVLDGRGRAQVIDGLTPVDPQ